MHDFTQAVIVNILPTLARRPKAMFDWLAFLVTTMRIEKEYDWTAASDYVVRTLARRIQLRQEFGAHQPGTINDVAIAAIARRHLAAARGASRDSHQPPGNGGQQQQRPTTTPRQQSGEYCKHWNFLPNGCKFTNNCNHVHQCAYQPACKTPSHRGNDCPLHKEGSPQSKSPSRRDNKDGRGAKKPAVVKAEGAK
jgi:hypothetical protein